MRLTRLIKIGGVMNLLFVVFHLSFWNLFDWPQGLASLSSDNRALMQVFNIHAAYVIAVFGILSLAFAKEMTTTRFGQWLGIAIAGFWILRAVNQVAFWNISAPESWVIIAVCLAVAALYLIPSMYLRKN